MPPISQLHLYVQLIPFLDVDGRTRPPDDATVLNQSPTPPLRSDTFFKSGLLHSDKTKMVYRLPQQWKSNTQMSKRQELHSKDSDDEQVNIIVPEWLNKMDLIAIECCDMESMDTPVATAIPHKTIKKSVLSKAKPNMSTANAMMIPIRLRHS